MTKQEPKTVKRLMNMAKNAKLKLENDLIYAVSFGISIPDEPTKHGGIRGFTRTEFAGFYKNREDAEKHKDVLMNKVKEINSLELMLSNIPKTYYNVSVVTFPLKSSFNENYL